MADALAPRLANALAGSDQGLDRELAEWGRWRDRESAERYWFAADLGAAGRPPAVLPEIVRRLHAHGDAGAVLEITSNRAQPSQVSRRRGCWRRPAGHWPAPAVSAGGSCVRSARCCERTRAAAGRADPATSRRAGVDLGGRRAPRHTPPRHERSWRCISMHPGRRSILSLARAVPRLHAEWSATE
jgi:hypothetical protein